MFEDDYKKEMNGIKPDPAVLQTVAENLNDGGTRSGRPKRRAGMIWGLSFAAVACACAVVLTTTLLPKSKAPVAGKETVVPLKNSPLKTSQSYDDLYEKLEKLTRYDDPYSNTIKMEDGSFVNAGGAVAKTYNSAVNDTASAARTASHTKTNIQVDGVDEADIVKTDGKFIYTVSRERQSVRIFAADGKKSRLHKELKIGGNKKYNQYITDLYLTEDRLVVLCTRHANFSYASAGRLISLSNAVVYDISDPAKISKVGTCNQSGHLFDSRMIGDTLYMITDHTVYGDIQKNDPETFVPSVGCNDAMEPVKADHIRIYPFDDLRPDYTVIAAFDTKTAKTVSDTAVLGGGGTVYCSTGYLVLARACYYEKEAAQSSTLLTCFTLNDGDVTETATGKIDGTLLNQFSMDEYNGTFRFVTTVREFETERTDSDLIARDTTHAKLTVLNKNFRVLGCIDNLAPGERVYSVRFMGKTAYFVTFRETDPLFSADLSDPENPKIIGKLKIPGFSDFLFPFGDGKLLGIGMDADVEDGAADCIKLSMFDIRDPANVTESGKIRVEDAYHSSALYDHKACVVDTERGIVAFQCYCDDNSYYRVFDAENGFRQLASIPTGDDADVRGIYIGDCLYLTRGHGITVYDTARYSEISRISQ